MSDSDSNDDNPIRYGTPLEPYEEDEIPTKRKYQQPADQYAVDANGQRRFHGAFTGGFSAGFGNTVGSQEGWTPATFKSSRCDKAKSSSQRPEDFMDEEDRSEFGIAPKYMQTHSEFSGQKRSRPKYHDGPIPGEPVLDQLIRTVHETAAVKMLRAMGWRPGQGTGDRLTKSEKKKAREQQKVYGCYMPQEMRDNLQSQSQDSEDSTDSEFEYDTLFAPDDYEPYILSRKSDRFGLGYQGLSRHSVLGNMTGEYGEASAKSHLLMNEKGKKVSIRGQAFGVGALEDEDEDIYSNIDMSHYDFAIGGPPTEKVQKKKPAEKSNNVLPGFVPAKIGLPSVPSHPPPALPRDYAPAPMGKRKTRFDQTDAIPRDQGLGRHELSAEARGALLGEAPLKPPENPQTTKEDLLAQISGRSVNFVSTNVENNDLNKIDSINKTDSTTSNRIENIIDMTVPQSSTPDFISIKDSGKELTNVFKPFVGNPAKQRRYEKYLENKNSALEKDGEMDRLSVWEREREMVEFEQAAKLYKPLTGVMGDRFTHAAAPDDATNPLAAVTKSSTSYGIATPEQLEAAARGAYGVMTRSDRPWQPHSIVCKRFNVPDPGGCRPESPKEDKPKISYSIFSYLEESVHDKDSFTKEQTKFSGSKSHLDKPLADPKPAEIVSKDDNVDKQKDEINQVSNSNEGHRRITAAELFLRESEKNKQQGEEVTKTIDKFDKMDLYKSIFLSDSEEEEEFANNTERPTIIDDFNDIPLNVERNTSPPRGIFANIDFDEINSWRRNVKPNQDTAKDKKDDADTVKGKEKDASVNKEKGNVVEEMETEVYGPKIPENIQKRLGSIDSNKVKDDVHEIASSSSDSWVDAKEVQDKKKKKKSKHKKHKSKHKKSKHKKKDR